MSVGNVDDKVVWPGGVIVNVKRKEQTVTTTTQKDETK